jgi:hypothetical protein
VAQVEDVPLGGLALLERVLDLALDDVERGEDQRRVQVALHRLARADALHRLRQRHAPVDADDVRARLAHVVQQLAGADAEVDARHVRHGGQDAGAVRLDVRAVVRRGQRAHPRVEQLHGARPGVDLHPQEGQGDRGEPVEQLRPERGLAVHQRLRAAWFLLGRPRRGSSRA